MNSSKTWCVLSMTALFNPGHSNLLPAVNVSLKYEACTSRLRHHLNPLPAVRAM